MVFSHSGLLSNATGLDTAAPSALIEERPPPGVLRGRYAASKWSIALFGTALVLGTLLYFFVRLRNRPR